MYFADLSPYTYIRVPADCGRVLNVGWLSVDEPFPTGETSRQFVARLQKVAKKRINMTRGYHGCEFCASELLAEAGEEMAGLQIHDELVGLEALGNGEILVRGAAGECYIAPVMIVHYIELHNYLPPQEFIDAVLNGAAFG
ncbi:hypothetical protein ACFC06_12250 [Nocardia sp. NPDC056064]|uniref:DUF7919 family protein n=1 Tax=Nocardia sp. NPDC056064 TaxID=3345701 RepID=UPI0035DCB966